MDKELRVVILAAGKGTRMNSSLPKVLHKLCGKSLIDYVLDESELFKPVEVILVVGFEKNKVILPCSIGGSGWGFWYFKV